MTEGRSESSINGHTVTVDLGYVSFSLLKRFMSIVIGVIMVMPEYRVRAHPFVGKSNIIVVTDDVKDTESESEDK